MIPNYAFFRYTLKCQSIHHLQHQIIRTYMKQIRNVYCCSQPKALHAAEHDTDEPPITCYSTFHQQFLVFNYFDFNSDVLDRLKGTVSSSTLVFKNDLSWHGKLSKWKTGATASGQGNLQLKYGCNNISGLNTSVSMDMLKLKLAGARILNYAKFNFQSGTSSGKS